MIKLFCNRISLFATASVAIAASWLLTTPQAPAQYGGMEVAMPRYVFKDGTNHISGRCFAARWNGRNYLLTTLHQLGPGGGYGRQLRQSELNSLVDHVDAIDTHNTVFDTAKTSVLTKDSGASTANFPSDMMAFELPSSTRLRALDLSPSLVPARSHVSVCTWDFNSSGGATRYSATVTRSDPSTILLHSDSALPAASSGSPVIDGRGSVIGILVGMMNSQRTDAIALPSSGIAARLTAEARR
jgi:hypothetical protein